MNATTPLTLQMVRTDKKRNVVIQQDSAWPYTTSVTQHFLAENRINVFDAFSKKKIKKIVYALFMERNKTCFYDVAAVAKPQKNTSAAFAIEEYPTKVHAGSFYATTLCCTLYL